MGRRENVSSKAPSQCSYKTSIFFAIVALSFATIFSSHFNLVYIQKAILSAEESSLLPVNNSNSSSSSKSQSDASALAEWRRTRAYNATFWFTEVGNELKDNADADGPILDYIIAGHPKTGTTTMEDNLAYLTPIPRGTDVCTPLKQTIWYSYHSWQEKYGSVNKTLKGTKCPSFLETADLSKFSLQLPKTKLIVGIRHPVLWFESFWNMMVNNHRFIKNMSVYNHTTLCRTPYPSHRGCRYACANKRHPICVHRARFHIHLARLGKSSLNETERTLLAPNDRDAGNNIVSWNVTNDIFLYEQTELNSDILWEELASFLQVPRIRHDRFAKAGGFTSIGENYTRMNICDAAYDDLRKQLMPYAHEMSRWVCDYFVPAKDVVVADPERFCKIVRNYTHDPCGRLVRTENGTYGYV